MGSKRRVTKAFKTRYNNGPNAEQLRAGFSAEALHCRSLTDMTEAEIVALEQEYGAPVLRPRRLRRATRRAH